MAEHDASGRTYQRAWSSKAHVARMTVDLSEHPDMVVMYLGMRINSIRGIFTLLRFGRRMMRSMEVAPEGLLHWERIAYSPRQFGLRTYWRDLGTLEGWARVPPHLDWWKEYLRDTKGTGFWHETYFMRGGMEAIYDGMPTRIGLAAFAPTAPAEGGLFSARHRIERARAAAAAKPAEDAPPHEGPPPGA